MWCTYTVEYCSAVRKKRHHDICRQMGGTRKDHPEGANPDPERQECDEFTYTQRVAGK